MNCDRCLDPIPAVEVTHLGVGDTLYTMRLCSKHHGALHDDLRVWTRLGQRVSLGNDPEPLVPSLTPPQDPWAEIADILDDRPDPGQLERLWRAAGEWTFSAHANQRLTGRHFELADVLQLLADPDVRRPGEPGSDTQVWGRGGVRTVVDVHARTVVTLTHPAEVAA